MGDQTRITRQALIVHKRIRPLDNQRAFLLKDMLSQILPSVYPGERIPSILFLEFPVVRASD